MTDHDTTATMTPKTTDHDITVTMTLQQWEIILQSEPFSQETYTDHGVTVFESWGAIHKAVNPAVNPS